MMLEVANGEGSKGEGHRIVGTHARGCTVTIHVNGYTLVRPSTNWSTGYESTRMPAAEDN